MISVQAKGLSIYFHALDFRGGEDKEYEIFEFGKRGIHTESRTGRNGAVLVGQRNLAQQTLEKCNFRG
jgi:hypothetical protein